MTLSVYFVSILFPFYLEKNYNLQIVSNYCGSICRYSTEWIDFPSGRHMHSTHFSIISMSYSHSHRGSRLKMFYCIFYWSVSLCKRTHSRRSIISILVHTGIISTHMSIFSSSIWTPAFSLIVNLVRFYWSRSIWLQDSFIKSISSFPIPSLNRIELFSPWYPSRSKIVIACAKG